MFGSYVWVDKGDPTRYLLYVSQGGLSLPDESYYREEQHAGLRDALPEHVARMLVLAPPASPPRSRPRGPRPPSWRWRRASPRSHWDTVTTRDAVKTYNLTTGAAAGRAAAGLARVGRRHRPARGRPAGGRRRARPPALRGLAEALAEEPLETPRTWLRWRVVTSMALYLSQPLVEENFAFYGTKLSGTPQMRERWKRGVSLVEGVLGEAVGELYVARHYPPEAHARMVELVENLIAAYRERIEGLDLDVAGDQGARAGQARRPSRRRSPIPFAGATTPPSDSRRRICSGISVGPPRPSSTGSWASRRT